MKVIDKIIKSIKSIFKKEKEVKLLEEPKSQIVKENKKEQFVKELKYSVPIKISGKNIEVLICEGSGLGIQKKLTC